MKKKILHIVFLVSGVVIGQTTSADSLPPDSKYKEDQFFINHYYNLLGDKPDGLSQRGYSSGLALGFIKDMPINKQRNLAIGLGLGLSGNIYNQNLLITKNNQGEFDYTLLSDTDLEYSKNMFTTYLVEVPLEFRWRTSTPTEYSFWRIYAGIKMGYLFANGTKFKGETETVKYNNIKVFENLQYGLTLSVGYGTVNGYLYYGLNPVFSEGTELKGETLQIKTIKIGLMFYIL